MKTRETQTRARIRRAVESRGYTVVSLDWEPVYNAGEMCGLAGGWRLVADRTDHELFGLSADELLATVDYFLQPPEPCGCDMGHSAMMAAGVINDPQRPTHGSECPWHIPYRLRWWPAQRGGASMTAPKDNPAVVAELRGPMGEDVA